MRRRTTKMERSQCKGKKKSFETRTMRIALGLTRMQEFDEIGAIRDRNHGKWPPILQ